MGENSEIRWRLVIGKVILSRKFEEDCKNKIPLFGESDLITGNVGGE